MHDDFRVLEGHLQQGKDNFMNWLEGYLVIQSQMWQSNDGRRVLWAKQLLGKVAILKHAWVLFKPSICVTSHLIERIIIITIADVTEMIFLVRHYQHFMKRIELGWFLMNYVEFLANLIEVSLVLMHPVIQKYLGHIVLYLVHKIIVGVLKIPY